MAAQEAQPVGGDDWDGIVRRSVDFSIRSINESERSVEVVASTDTIDAHGDVVEQKFDLKRYRKNPVVLWNHNRFEVGWIGGAGRPKDFMPIGRAEDGNGRKGARIEDGQLVAKLFFFKDPDPDQDKESLARDIFLRFQQGIINAVSIGFRPGKVTEELDDHGKAFYRLSQNELFEISVVPIPSNPDAVAKSISLEHEHLRRLAVKGAQDGEPQEPSMDPKEIQKTLEKAQSDLAVAKADLERAEKALADERAKVAELEQKLAESEGALKESVEKLAESADRVLKLEGTVAERDVDAIVGKKIMPAERDEFLELRKGNPDLYKRMVEKRTDMKLDKSVIAEDADPNDTTTKGGASKRLADKAKA